MNQQEFFFSASAVVKSFGDICVLKGIDLEVKKGEVIGLIGPSGSGKTTLLRCINMLEEYEAGEIRIDGEVIGYRIDNGKRVRLSERVIADQRTRVGMVFQSFNLFPHLTAEGNINLGLTKVHKMPLAQAQETALKWLDRVGLLDKKDSYPIQLSGGQQQRVAIARAVAMKPKLMLFDEITSALDPELVGEVLFVMKDLAQSGMTMMAASHEMLFVRDVASRVIFMDGGHIVEQGDPAAVLGNPQSERLKAFLANFQASLR